MSRHEALPDIELVDQHIDVLEDALQDAEYDDHPQDECGVYAIFAPDEPVALITYGALHELQHRGQSGAGMTLYDRSIDWLWHHKGAGMVDAAIPQGIPYINKDGSYVSRFDEMFHSPVSIGHTRYSTSGGEKNAQPFFGDTVKFALAQNGHIQDLELLTEEYAIKARMVDGQPESDTSLVTRIFDKRAGELNGNLDEALDEILPKLEGAYCFTITDGKRVMGIRDPWGFHPLSLGELPEGKGYVLASESVAFVNGNARFIRDIEPGEIITIDESGYHSRFINREVKRRQHCMYEFIYTARPDSIIEGRDVYVARKNMGKYLALDHPAKADVVVGVPSSGLAAAAGFAQISGLPLVEGIFKNAYAPRSFIMAGEAREAILRRKLHPNVSELDGKRIVLVDDSVIKGNTMRALIGLLRTAGAAEIHVRSAASRYEYGCYMGMDTSDVSKLIAAGRTDIEISEEIGADSIGFNTAENIELAINEARVKGSIELPLGSFCTACTTGDYVIESPTAKRALSDRSVVNLGMPVVRKMAAV